MTDKKIKIFKTKEEMNKHSRNRLEPDLFPYNNNGLDEDMIVEEEPRLITGCGYCGKSEREPNKGWFCSEKRKFFKDGYLPFLGFPSWCPLNKNDSNQSTTYYLMKGIEFVEVVNGKKICPQCGGSKNKGHKEGCKLSLWLKGK